MIQYSPWSGNLCPLLPSFQLVYCHCFYHTITELNNLQTPLHEIVAIMATLLNIVWNNSSPGPWFLNTTLNGMSSKPPSRICSHHGNSAEHSLK